MANLLEKNAVSLVCSREPFLKQAFMEEAVRTQLPVIYLDFDLMYSGYVGMGAARQQPGTTLLQVRASEAIDALARTAAVISRHECLVIMDSLNGLCSMPGTGRAVQSYVMILADAARRSGSPLVCACISSARGGPVLYPPGVELERTAGTGVIVLGRSGEGVTAELLQDGHSAGASATIRVEDKTLL